MASPANNPYDLRRGGGGGGRWRAPPRREARVWTESEIAERLEGYLLVPPEHYANVRAGTHIRYYKSDGSFKAGAFVAKNPADGEDGEAQSMLLGSSTYQRSEGYFSWSIAYEDIARLYIRPDATTLVTADLMSAQLAEVVDRFNENLQTLTAYVKKKLFDLESRVTAIESAAGDFERVPSERSSSARRSRG